MESAGQIHWKHVKNPIWDLWDYFLERVENLGNYDVLEKWGKYWDSFAKTWENNGKHWTHLIKDLKLPSLLGCKKKIVNVVDLFVLCFKWGKKLQTVRCLVGGLRVVKDFWNCQACLGVETCRFGAFVSCKHELNIHIGGDLFWIFGYFRTCVWSFLHGDLKG